MSYGTASTETMIVLRGLGYEDSTNLSFTEPEDIYARIDVVCYGALDESFEINDMWHYEQIVDAIADFLKGKIDLDEWEVDAYHPNPDLCEKLYGRSSDEDESPKYNTTTGEYEYG